METINTKRNLSAGRLMDHSGGHPVVMIVGITGQTGSLLGRLLHRSGYHVVGTTRRKASPDSWRLDTLGIRDLVDLETMEPSSSVAVQSTLERVRPKAVFFLGGQSSVAASFERPQETYDSIAGAVQNLLESIRFLHLDATFINSASSDMFGNQPGIVLDETQTMRPVSPYGLAKLDSYNRAIDYRKNHGVRAINAILSNHESPLRTPNFVSQKVVRQVREMMTGDRRVLELANPNVARDWLWAEDVAEGLLRLLSVETPSDFIIASGRTRTLEDLAKSCATAAGIQGQIAIRETQDGVRPVDIPKIELDPRRFITATGWRPETSFEEMAAKLVHQII